MSNIAVSQSAAKKAALRFVLMIGAVSLFADFAYEGSRSIVGPYVAQLGATGTAVGIIAGLGEFLGYALRLVSGKLSDKTGAYWPITLFGYGIQMISVPLLALAGSWQIAALLIVVERIGRATRNPPRDVMLSNAGNIIGFGWAFGLNEALDQTGAMIGPLSVAAVLGMHGQYKMAFAMLLIPALITLTLLVAARLLYPRPEEMEAHTLDLHTTNLPRVFWIYLIGAALVAAGFPDFSMMSFYFEKANTVSDTWIPILYALAMGTSGLGSLVFGKLFDHKGLGILIPLTLITVPFVPLVFLGGFYAVLVGCALWGMGMGVHESIVAAAVSKMVPLQRRASAYGIFSTAYGISWFLGSAVIGFLYDRSLPALIAFSVGAELAAIPFFFIVARKEKGFIAEKNA